MVANNTYVELFSKVSHCTVRVYSFFDNKTALVFDPNQAGRCNGNGWQTIALKKLIPLEYVTNDMYMSKTTKNQIKERLVLSHAVWTCTDGTSFDNCEAAIDYERALMERVVGGK